MTEYAHRAQLQVAEILAEFVEERLLPGLPIAAEAFWSGYGALLGEP